MQMKKWFKAACLATAMGLTISAPQTSAAQGMGGMYGMPGMYGMYGMGGMRGMSGMGGMRGMSGMGGMRGWNPPRS